MWLTVLNLRNDNCKGFGMAENKFQNQKPRLKEAFVTQGVKFSWKIGQTMSMPFPVSRKL